MECIDKLRERVANSKKVFVQHCILAAIHIVFGILVILIVLRCSDMMYNGFVTKIKTSSSAILDHPLLLLIMAIWVFVQGIVILCLSFKRKDMTLERALLEHIDKKS